MVSIFGNMINNLKDEQFIKCVAESMPSEPEITPEFTKKYNEYQQKNQGNKKKISKYQFV
ncbi:hypothetical protein [Sporosarcina luteola]|uniref:hypothetical protein n=1 Tax=Sporosarcina luteola TaxID=582850 RepID=UPI002042699A|nr:hypothetical protein [Sporosarcina luteola]MCM3711956.1 hypothetical protein [Sporosarcina luteola]